MKVNSSAEKSYPYDYATDYVRSVVGYNMEGTRINEHEAKKLILAFSDALNVDEEIAAECLAVKEMEKTGERGGSAHG